MCLPVYNLAGPLEVHIGVEMVLLEHKLQSVAVVELNTETAAAAVVLVLVAAFSHYYITTITLS